jgi:hypothetical protein
MLTADQIETFRRDGVLILRGLFSPDKARAWREEVLDYFGRPASPDEWRAALRTHKADSFFLSDDPTPRMNAKLAKIYGSLHATAQWHGDNELVMRPGDEELPWLGARAAHLDFPVYAPLRTLANDVIYLSDVQEHGGAFMYWPGSHHVAWQYFRRNPDDYLSQGERTQDQTFAILKGEMKSEPVEFIGTAGDVLIWHSLIFHSASVNKRTETRFAIFGRWGVPLSGEPVYDFNGDMWAYWNFDAAGSHAEIRQ